MTRSRFVIGGFVLAASLGLLVSTTRAQCCGDCNDDGEVTVDEVVTAVNRALTSCPDDRICSIESCPAQLAQCRGDIDACRSLSGGQAFPASGLTTSYGPGSDGQVQAGATLSYTDNGDGTITDNNTRLMWEKKDDSGGIHAKDNTYTWGMRDAPYTMNGTMVTTFLRTLNSPPCFAGHCDWRIPNVRELQSIVDYEVRPPGPIVSTSFNNAAGCPGCTDVTQVTCSCTSSRPYWTSTSSQWVPQFAAWIVPFFFASGVTYDLGADKSAALAVRAVRGGS